MFDHAKKILSLSALAISGLMFVPLAATVTTPVHAVTLPDFTDLVDKVGPAVVNIRTTEKNKGASAGAQGGPQGGAPGMDDEEMQEFFRRFFGQPAPRSCLPHSTNP